MQGGAVIKTNVPIERHASRIYTRTMFEIFGRVLFVAGSYDVIEVVPRSKYVAYHINPSAMKEWYKTKFVVEVYDDCEFFKCECYRYEHMGMVCCHILKVRDCVCCRILSHHLKAHAYASDDFVCLMSTLEWI